MLAIGKTWMAKKEESDNHEWYVIDADAHIVGRLASRIATVLMGKHKPNYTAHVDTGGCVIVLNCERIRFTGNSVQHSKVPYMTTKMVKKKYDRYTGFPVVCELAQPLKHGKNALINCSAKLYVGCCLRTS